MTPTFDELFREYQNWQYQTFTVDAGEQDPHTKAMKLQEEVEELLSDPLNGEEMVDVIMIIIGLARLGNVNLKEEFIRKFEINKNRKWTVGPNGVHRHE